jgi:methionyl aminopeptidase
MTKNYVKSKDTIEKMRKGGKILGKILKEIRLMIEPGVNEFDLEDKFLELCEKYNVRAACKGYAPRGHKPFPTGLCVGINEECVHCIPSKDRKIQEGDLVNVDTIIEYKGKFIDSAFTIGIGSVGKERQRLLDTTYTALNSAIKQAKPGNKIGDISYTIQTIANMAGFDVLREYTGHGIGDKIHEPPSVPCWGNKNEGEELHPGMTIAIEPLVCSGNPKVQSKEDSSWETEMADGGDFVQVEHTVLITQKGPEILTK